MLMRLTKGSKCVRTFTRSKIQFSCWRRTWTQKQLLDLLSTSPSLSLSNIKSIIVNCSVRSPSVFSGFFCVALQKVSVVTCAPSVEGKWFFSWRITGFSQAITAPCRHHESWLSFATASNLPNTAVCTSVVQQVSVKCWKHLLCV